MKKTAQEQFWSSNFGFNYIERNKFSTNELDYLYKKNFGVTRSKLNKEFLNNLKLNNILEVGCNIGNQLAMLQKQGFKNLYGIEIFPKAVELAKAHTKNINIVQGSVFDLPFKDRYFDLVFTAGVLIHINPKNLKKAMGEIYRTSNKYIWGYEYYSSEHTAINYRKNKDRLWKGDFAKLYLKYCQNLKLIKLKKIKYLESENIDEMFLLKKII